MSNSAQWILSDKAEQSLLIRRVSPPKNVPVSQKTTRGSLCATVQQKSIDQSINSGSVLRRLRPGLCSPRQCLSGCGAHHPTFTTATPEIKIMSGLKLLHPGESSGERAASHVSFPSVEIIPSVESIRAGLASKYSHTSPFSGADDDSPSEAA